MRAARLPPHARIAGVATFLPEHTRTSTETEERLRRGNAGLGLATGLIRRVTGVESVHVRPEGWQTSDLAVAAARQLLQGPHERPDPESPQSPEAATATATAAAGPIDLLLFASASQDLIEPATSHIVAAKLGLTCPVMDVKNACNSLINALQVADALVATGQHRRVLVVSGEQPSHAVRWRLDDPAQFLRSFAGYTMSDGGAAVLVEATDDRPGDELAPGILGSRFAARSEHWAVGTLPTGGSMNPHAEGGSYFDMDGAALQRAFLEVGVGLVGETLAELGVAPGDLDFVAVHQVAAPYHAAIVEAIGVDPARTVLTVAEHGNLASVSLPLQLQLARERGLAGDGSLVALIGLAGGISLGVMVVRL